MKYSGGCSCGAVHYETSAEPVLQGNCHCRECQRMTGSAYSATLFFPADAVNIRGETRSYSRIGSNGKTVERRFCPECGSQLFGRPGSLPGLLGIRAGTLDDASMYAPAVNIFTRSAAAWDHLDPALPNFPEMPPLP
ncbi:MAG: GFA family protein [Azonexus sp.]|jgi:hypothetical protein|nr:GFA family protein [Azonexus sp.]